MANKPRVMEAIGTLVQVFHEHASKHKESESGGQFTLSKAELKEIAKEEMGLDSVKDSAKLDELMKELDDDLDGQVNFKEYLEWVTNAASAANNFLETYLGGFSFN